MVWKKHTTLAVGHYMIPLSPTNGSFLVFWYCQGKEATSTANPNGDGANLNDF
jgi:hypothetical protein